MIIANILGIFFFLYLLWKVLKDDYVYEKIFNLAFLILIGILTTFFISNYFHTQYWFWIICLGIITVFLFAIKIQKIKFFESFEALIISILPWVGLVFLTDSINHSHLFSFILFWVTLMCVFLYFFLISHYRSFAWYKSGRVGFSGIITGIIFFLVRSIISLFSTNIFSMIDIFEIYFSGGSALLLCLLLYNLFRHKE